MHLCTVIVVYLALSASRFSPCSHKPHSIALRSVFGGLEHPRVSALVLNGDIDGTTEVMSPIGDQVGVTKEFASNGNNIRLAFLQDVLSLLGLRDQPDTECRSSMSARSTRAKVIKFCRHNSRRDWYALLAIHRLAKLIRKWYLISRTDIDGLLGVVARSRSVEQRDTQPDALAQEHLALLDTP